MKSIKNLLHISYILLAKRHYRSSEELSKCIHAIPIILTLCFLPGLAFATSVTLAWDPNREPDLAGYRIYYGETSGEYSFEQDVGNRTKHTLSYLGEGRTYYFAVTAYNRNGLESDYSRELAYTVPGEFQGTQADPPPDNLGGDPGDSRQPTVRKLQAVQTSAVGSTLNFGFNLNLVNVPSLYRAELKFRAASALPFISVFYENKWIKALASVKASDWIIVDVTDIALKSSGLVSFKLQCSGLTGGLSVDQVVDNLALVIYSGSNGIPVAAFTANPMSGAAPLMVGFDATAAFDPDGYLVEYEWEFGDDNYSDAGATVNHLYIDPGVYTAKLTMTDDVGNAGFQEIQITVSEQSYDRNSDNATIIISPSEINNDAFAFEIGAINGTITGAALRFRVLETYTKLIIVNVDNDREVARKYSIRPDLWHEIDLANVVNMAGTYVFEILGQELYGVRLLPVTDFEAIELVLTVGNY